MILKAAILQCDSRIVYVGHKHNDCFNMMRDQGVTYKYCIQGFVDTEGNFLDRHEAYQEALRCGQIKEKSINNEIKINFGDDIKCPTLEGMKILISEDLY
jgi:hypothetical protein